MAEKSLLDELIEREKEYLDKHEVGTKEYNDSLKRLTELENQHAERAKELENRIAEKAKYDEEKKARMQQNIIEVGKFVVGGVIIPVVGLVCITATEKDTTFTGALRDYTRLFLPKKVN